LFRTINGEKHEIPQSVIGMINEKCDVAEGVGYDEIFQILEEYAGITVDMDRAVALFKMHFVNGILASIGGSGGAKNIFAGRNEDSEQRHWSLKVLPDEILSRILEGYKKALGKLQARMETLKHRITDVETLLKNKTLELDDDVDMKEIEESFRKRETAQM
jgi:hypothetical protein